MKPVLQSLPGTGTFWGYSFWTSLLTGCPRKIHFARQGDKPRSALSGKEAIDVGTLVHAYLALWYTIGDSFDAATIRWRDPGVVAGTYLAKVQKEAEQTFRNYRLAHKPNEWGKIIATEKSHQLKNWMGLHTFDWRPDMEVGVPAKRAKSLGLPSGGIYIPDHKTLDRPSDGMVEWTRRELRFTAYDVAHRTEIGKEFKGVIINAVYRGKKGGCERFYVPPPDSNALKRLETTFARAAEVERRMAEITTPTMCATRFETCEFIDICEGH